MKLNEKNSIYIKKLVLCAMLIAVGIILPFFTGQIKEIGKMLLPMHIPVFLCGLVCGGRYGLAAGVITPILRSLLFSMPVLYPGAIAMAAELGTYGLVSGIIFGLVSKKNIVGVYASMLPAMVIGRIVWGLVQIVLYNIRLVGFDGGDFTMRMFMAGAFFEAIPGIILQLVVVPLLVTALARAGFFAWRISPSSV